MPKFLVRLAVILAFLFTASGCGFDGSYRYPCQAPENWKAAECNPPVCIATGTCTRDILPGVQDDTIDK